MNNYAKQFRKILNGFSAVTCVAGLLLLLLGLDLLRLRGRAAHTIPLC